LELPGMLFDLLRIFRRRDIGPDYSGLAHAAKA
jgi:hypothetical protein